MDGPLRRARGRGNARRAPGRLEDLAPRDGRRTADEKVTRGDETIERAAEKLQQAAQKAAASGGLKAKLAEPLAEDAAFVRKLKPSLIAARAKGQAPTNQKPGTDVVVPSGPQLGPRAQRKTNGGLNPFLIVGVALAAGILLAKIIDWRGHAHPRD